MTKTLKFGDLKLAPDQCRAWRGDRAIDLSNNQTRVLGHLMNSRNRLQQVEDIADDLGLTVSHIRNLVREIRQKLGAPNPIRTVMGGGYILVAPEPEKEIAS